MQQALIVAPSEQWMGIDGNWSTFSVSVGHPIQTFRILPRTMGEGVWVPMKGCCLGDPPSARDCALRRGALPKDALNGGFQYNASQSWDQIGSFGLGLRTYVPGGQGFFGLDSVTFGTASNIPNQVVAGIVDERLWLGSVGLGPATSSLGAVSRQPSLMQTLKTLGIIPSLSYGYTAGRAYTSPAEPGSLILGGFDRARFSLTSITAPIAKDNLLQISLESIIATNAESAVAIGLLPEKITVSLDSAVSQLWLPAKACGYFEQAFGLIYDPTSELYFIGGVDRGSLQNAATQITFTLTSVFGRTNIVLGYNAFNLTVRPLLAAANDTRAYFPIRRSPDGAQLTLGRVFLQESYLVVDWERGNFTIGQLANAASNVVAITAAPKAQNNSRATSHASASKYTNGPPPGAIAAIILTLALLALLFGLAARFWVRSLRQRASPRVLAGSEATVANAGLARSEDTPQSPEHSSKITAAPATLYELGEGSTRERPLAEEELMSAPVCELESPIGELVGGELTLGQALRWSNLNPIQEHVQSK